MTFALHCHDINTIYSWHFTLIIHGTFSYFTLHLVFQLQNRDKIVVKKEMINLANISMIN